VGSRADLCGAADRSPDLLRGQETTAVTDTDRVGNHDVVSTLRAPRLPVPVRRGRAPIGRWSGGEDASPEVPTRHRRALPVSPHRRAPRTAQRRACLRTRARRVFDPHHGLQGSSPGGHNDRWRFIYDRLSVAALTRSRTVRGGPRALPALASAVPPVGGRLRTGKGWRRYPERERAGNRQCGEQASHGVPFPALSWRLRRLPRVGEPKAARDAE
jgi:hypothetical protein